MFKEQSYSSQFIGVLCRSRLQRLKSKVGVP